MSETDVEVMHLWTLRIKIDGEWFAADFEYFFRLIDELYALAIGLELRGRGSWFDSVVGGRTRGRRQPPEYERFLSFLASERQGRMADRLEPHLNRFFHQEHHLDLDVTRIEYGSSGFADVLGFGAAIGHMKDFILRLIELHETKTQRQLDTVEKRLALQAQQIQNARDFVQLVVEARGGEVPEEMLRKLVLRTDEVQVELLSFAERGQLTGAEIVESS